MRHKFEVIVGNVGSVYSGNNYMIACGKWSEYVKQAKAHYGRAAGEDVTLLRDGEIDKEHIGYMTKEQSQ